MSKVIYKFRVGKYFKKGMPYQLILVKGTKIYNRLNRGMNFTNEYEGDGDGFNTTIICDGFDTDNTRAIFIAYDSKKEEPLRFTITADDLAKSIGLQDDGTIGEADRDDYICITRIPTWVWNKGATEDCFGSKSGNVPSFMLENVLRRAGESFSPDEFFVGKAYHIKAGKNQEDQPWFSIQDRIVLRGCDGIFAGYAEDNTVARFLTAYPNDSAPAIDMTLEFTTRYVEKWDLQITELKPYEPKPNPMYDANRPNPEVIPI